MILYLAPVRALLPSHWEYHFLQGPLECGPAPGIDKIYPGQTYNCWFFVPSLIEFQSVHEYLEEVIEDEGPFDAAWGFSAVCLHIYFLVLSTPPKSPDPQGVPIISNPNHPRRRSLIQIVHSENALTGLLLGRDDNRFSHAPLRPGNTPSPSSLSSSYIPELLHALECHVRSRERCHAPCHPASIYPHHGRRSGSPTRGRTCQELYKSCYVSTP